MVSMKYALFFMSVIRLSIDVVMLAVITYV